MESRRSLHGAQSALVCCRPSASTSTIHEGSIMSPRRIGSALLGLFLLTGTVMAQTSTNESISALPDPPQAKKVPRVTAVHGDSLFDDYYWLREKTNPEVISYLDAENTYTAAVMKPTETFQETLYREILGRIKETDLTVPHRQGDWYYYSRTEQGKQYRIECRKHGSLDAK